MTKDVQQAKRYNLWQQTGLAFMPLIVAAISYLFLPAKIFILIADTSLSPWGIKTNIFVYPIFCLALWAVLLFFIYFNRVREDNLIKTHEAFRSLEGYYLWGGWVIEALALIVILIQVIVTAFH